MHPLHEAVGRICSGSATHDQRGCTNEMDAFHTFVTWPDLRACQTKMVLGHFCNQNISLGEKELKEAQRRIREDFLFVGVLEFYHESVCLYHQVGPPFHFATRHTVP